MTPRHFFVLGFICIALPITTMAQYGKEWAFAIDNDVFLLKFSDAYYTNGLFLRYSKAAASGNRKRIHQFELGQQIFTPLSKSASNIDRPYCGYLFTRYSQLNETKNKGLLTWQVNLGVLGPASLGEQLQNSYHNLFSFKRFEGWKYQVRSAIGVDAGISYAKDLVHLANAIRIIPTAEAQLGSNFTGARIGSFFCIGQSNGTSSGTLFKTRIGKQDPVAKKTELFLFWNPSLKWQAYNSTLQGNLFHKGSGAVLAQPIPWLWEQRYGVCFSYGRWSTRVELVNQSKETSSQNNTHSYGSLQLACRMF